MTQIISNQFGTGTIVSQDANNVTVDFNGTVKILIIKYAKLTNVDGTPFGTAFVAPEKKTKKVNAANFRTYKELGSKSLADMSTSELQAWEQKREAAKWGSKSF